MHAVSRPHDVDKTANEAALRGALLAFSKPTLRIPDQTPVPTHPSRGRLATSPRHTVSHGKQRTPSATSDVRTAGSRQASAGSPAIISARLPRPAHLLPSKSDTIVPTLRNTGSEVFPGAKQTLHRARPIVAPSSIAGPPLQSPLRSDYFIDGHAPPQEDGNISAWLHGLHYSSEHLTPDSLTQSGTVYGNQARLDHADGFDNTSVGSTWPRRLSPRKPLLPLTARGKPPSILSPRPFRTVSAARSINDTPDVVKLLPSPSRRFSGQSLSPSNFDGASDRSRSHMRKASPLAISMTPEDHNAHSFELQRRQSCDSQEAGCYAITESRPPSPSPPLLSSRGRQHGPLNFASNTGKGSAHTKSRSMELSAHTRAERAISPDTKCSNTLHNATVHHGSVLNNAGSYTQRRVTPSLTGSSLASALAASNLATSRASSPSKPVAMPVMTRKATELNLLHPFRHHSPTSRTPSPVKGMRRTLRKDASSDEEEKDARHRKKKIFHKHPHKHHEGDRKRWRVQMTERAKKRYEGVWAANKGTFLDPTKTDLSAVELEAAKSRVANMTVRDIWIRSRLSPNVLADIWDLVDRDGIGYLTRLEFCVGLWLIDQRLRGRKLPHKLSDSDWSNMRGQGLKLPRLRGG